jgi:hypothetical protein
MPLRPLGSKFDYGFDMWYILQDGNRTKKIFLQELFNELFHSYLIPP